MFNQPSEEWVMAWYLARYSAFQCRLERTRLVLNHLDGPLGACIGCAGANGAVLWHSGVCPVSSPATLLDGFVHQCANARFLIALIHKLVQAALLDELSQSRNGVGVGAFMINNKGEGLSDRVELSDQCLLSLFLVNCLKKTVVHDKQWYRPIAALLTP